MSDCCNEFEFSSPQGTFYMDGGIRGKDGVTFYPHVSAAGILSWTNDGGKQNPDPVNIKGADGKSAYAAAQEAGFTGTEAEFNAWLAGIGDLTEDVSDLKSALTELTDLGTLTFNDGIFNAVRQRVETYSGYKYTKIPVSIYCGGYMKGITGITPNNTALGLSFVDEYDVVLATHYSTNTGSYKYEYNVQVPSGSIYVYINLRTASESLWVNPVFNLDVVFDNLQEIGEIKTELIETTNKINNIYNPVLRNGSIGNGSNANAVATNYILPIEPQYDYVDFEYIGDVGNISNYAFTYCLFKNATDGMFTSVAFADSTITKKNWNDRTTYKTNLPYIRIPIGDINQYDHFSVALFVFDDNGTVIPLRIATSQYCFKISYGFNQEKEIATQLNNARHIRGNSSTPLTILHFSDIHADVNAMNRILTDARNNNASIEQMICTGDIVNNSAEQISSWWNENVLTCIGNHDTASYSGGSYNWTALSMADRDAYYIAPFESNWGITHTSGTSYYYKDYLTQKVRLIVMDVMLYNDNGAEATAQTLWLENLLADAITSNLHVLIAIHAPHGGATAEECSFSKYGQTAMPTLTNCNTPQAVIDAVATKITAGLKFIGYICGHTHQDNIWDAENDGKQLMYCITCAIVSNANQWKDSDQNRSTFEDAYNIVTIDTANTLVKIIRGGGADIDDHMRTRKAICFNYTTGQKVGEVL